jgi:CO/xanthine dehydrogenase Mo-binding subunit
MSAVNRALLFHDNEDGTVTVTEGHPDIGGSRASMAMMVAEVLGVPFESVRPVVGDTMAIGFSASTGGSRVTFAGGLAITQAAQKVVEELKKRAAITWDISPEAG